MYQISVCSRYDCFINCIFKVQQQSTETELGLVSENSFTNPVQVSYPGNLLRETNRVAGRFYSTNPLSAALQLNLQTGQKKLYNYNQYTGNYYFIIVLNRTISVFSIRFSFFFLTFIKEKIVSVSFRN